MLYVNEIAEIVHGIVDKYSGAANKNIGDAFLLVWKYPERDVVFDDEIKNLVPKKSHKVSQVADMTVISFLKIIAQIMKSKKLEKYKKERILMRECLTTQLK
jgi:class 3 adenylate cyclase